MKTVLLIDGCVRGANSRTRKIADAYLKNLREKEEFILIERDLTKGSIDYLSADSFDPQTGQPKEGAHPLAVEFAGADEIILATPYWEFLFPAVVSCYFELISKVGITFAYGPCGSIGLCKAHSFTYIYTAGDDLSEGDKINEQYLRRLTTLYGISQFSVISADGLDIEGRCADDTVARLCQSL